MAELGAVTRALLDIARTLRDDRALAEQICRACVNGLDVDGAAISLLTASRLRETLYATDEFADLLEDLQFSLGEGACVDAATTGRSVVVPDITDPAQTGRWPVYAAAVDQAGIGAVFAFPLQWGAINLGVLDLYRRAPGALGAAQLRDAHSAAEAAALMLLGLRTDPDPHGDPDGDGAWDRSWSKRAEIHQATGMIVAQLGINPTDAFARLRAHAFTSRPRAGRGRARRRRPAAQLHRGHLMRSDGEGPGVDETTHDREASVIHAFVELADTLIDDYDIIDLLDRLAAHCVALLSADSAGILLADAESTLRVAATTDERTEWMELLQLQADEGPCLDCYRTAAPVSITDLAQAAGRWPQFIAALAERDHHGSVHALPLRLRGRAIGALNLFHRQAGALPEADLALGQALADVATIGILQERAIRNGEDLNEQLQTALNSRIIIEQAKGVLAQRGRLSVDAAFDHLRRYARSHNLRLSEVARQVVLIDLAADVLAAPPTPRRS